MFLDEATITVKGGDGGRGCVAWRREKYVAKGGPSGGDGGKGGDAYFLADENTDTLSDYASRKNFEAERGNLGSGQNRRGGEGKDLFLRVPPGTTVIEVLKDGQEIAEDLFSAGDQMLAAHGGRGGYGNAHFATATRQRPDFAELGEPGELKTFRLELRLVADVGIIGFPNVGKSTLISSISAARPKIADYPFTTLVPNLGVVKIDDRSYIVCDIPGIIEGANEGKGLGDRFLRHIERCSILLHVLDISHALPDAHGEPLKIEVIVQEYQILRRELAAHSPALAAKRELVVLNKIDLLGNDVAAFEDDLRKRGVPVHASISAATHFGVDDIAKNLLPLVLEERQKHSHVIVEDQTEELPVIRPHIDSDRMGAYRIHSSDEEVRISGKRLEQFTVMTDFSKSGAVRRFLDVIERIGLLKAIRKARGKAEKPVYIGTVRVDGFLP